MKHLERHRTDRIGWLRAAVLGANDGLVSTASLLVGVAAAQAGRNEILVAGLAGLAAGAMSMAAGEYVSVSSQSDTEKADLERERKEISSDWESEVNELTAIYVGRGVEPVLARQVDGSVTFYPLTKGYRPSDGRPIRPAKPDDVTRWQRFKDLSTSMPR